MAASVTPDHNLERNLGCFRTLRRGDDQAAAGRLYDQLLQHFDPEQLFMDVDAIEPGVDFVKSLDEQVAACIAFIEVIGPRWLNARNNDGSPRLDNPTDYVRVEIESALKRDIRVIPVLVDGASMPRPSDLPPSSKFGRSSLICIGARATRPRRAQRNRLGHADCRSDGTPANAASVSPASSSFGSNGY
jgi:TIR domain